MAPPHVPKQWPYCSTAAGEASRRLRPPLNMTELVAIALQAADRGRERRRGAQVEQINTQADDALSDLGPHAHQRSSRAEQASHTCQPDQRPGDLRVDDRHAG